MGCSRETDTTFWKCRRDEAKAALDAAEKTAWIPIAEAPKGVPVLIPNGLAMKKTGGEWFTTIEEPLYQKPLEKEPTHFQYLPTPPQLEEK